MNLDDIKNYISKKLDKNIYKIHHTVNKILDTDTPLSAAKKGKDTSMWLTIESVKNKESDIAISAGNTGALFVIAKLNLKMIEKIDKPALSALWPNKNGMNIVLDLGANLECNEKNLVDFSFMGAALHKSLFENEDAKVAILNIGSENIDTIFNFAKKSNPMVKKKSGRKIFPPNPSMNISKLRKILKK